MMIKNKHTKIPLNYLLILSCTAVMQVSAAEWPDRRQLPIEPCRVN